MTAAHVPSNASSSFLNAGSHAARAKSKNNQVTEQALACCCMTHVIAFQYVRGGTHYSVCYPFLKSFRLPTKGSSSIVQPFAVGEAANVRLLSLTTSATGDSIQKPAMSLAGFHFEVFGKVIISRSTP